MATESKRFDATHDEKWLDDLVSLHEQGNGWNPVEYPGRANAAERAFRDKLVAEWPRIMKLLQAPRSETAPLVAGDLKTQREIHDSYAPSAIAAPEWLKLDTQRPNENQWCRVRLFSGTEFDGRYFDGDFESGCQATPRWITGAKVYGWRPK